MVEYNDSNKEKYRNILSNYIYLKTKDIDVIGMLIKYYYKEQNVFEIVSIHGNKQEYTSQNIFFDNTLIRFINVNQKDISKIEHFQYSDTLYDPYNIIQDEKKRIIENIPNNHDSEFNELQVGKTFRSEINYISKIEEPLDEALKNEQRYNSLVLFYSNIIMNENQLDVYKHAILYGLIFKNKIDLLGNNPKLHMQALYDARIKVEAKTAAKLKQKKLK